MGSMRSGLSPRLSIPIWPVPSCTVGGRAKLTGAIPAQLCLPSSQPREHALLPSPSGAPLPRLQHREVPMPTGAAAPGTSHSHSGEGASGARPSLTGPACLAASSPGRGGSFVPFVPPTLPDSGPARSKGPQPRCLTTPLKSPRQGAGQHWGGILKPGHAGGKAGQEPRRCAAPAWCSRNLSIRMGKRKVPSNHPGNLSKTQHDWPDRLGNSRKETAWPLCHGLEPPLWGEAPGRAQGCSPATCSHESSLAAGTE